MRFYLELKEVLSKPDFLVRQKAWLFSKAFINLMKHKRRAALWTVKHSSLGKIKRRPSVSTVVRSKKTNISSFCSLLEQSSGSSMTLLGRFRIRPSSNLLSSSVGTINSWSSFVVVRRLSWATPSDNFTIQRGSKISVQMYVSRSFRGSLNS